MCGFKIYLRGRTERLLRCGIERKGEINDNFRVFCLFGLGGVVLQNLPGRTLVMPFVETGNSGGGMVEGEGSQNMLHGNPQVQKEISHGLLHRSLKLRGEVRVGD